MAPGAKRMPLLRAEQQGDYDSTLSDIDHETKRTSRISGKSGETFTTKKGGSSAQFTATTPRQIIAGVLELND